MQRKDSIYEFKNYSYVSALSHPGSCTFFLGIFLFRHSKLRPVFPYEYAQSLGTLCGISGFPKKNRKPSAAPFTESILVFCGFDSQELDTFLAELKKGGLFTAALKAIVTPHNIFWDSQMLYQELASERASLS